MYITFNYIFWGIGLILIVAAIINRFSKSDKEKFDNRKN